jgi:hypothetical protein
MQRRSLILAFLSAAFAGCKALYPFADSRNLLKFEDVDAIEVLEGKQVVTTIADPDSIARIKEIYRTASWKPFLDTKPSRSRWLICKQGEETLVTLVWAGWLIELDAADNWMRKAKLSESDNQWLAEITSAQST